MTSPNRYWVDPNEVDGVVRELFGHVDEFSGLCQQFGRLVPSVTAFGGVASPAATAALGAHEALRRAQQLLNEVLKLATDNTRTAMANYRANDQRGVSAHRQIESTLASSASLVQRLQSGGLDAGGIHSGLQSHAYQVDAGIAEVYVGRNPSEVRLQPGDLVTTANLTATVGADGRLYANGVPVRPPAGQEARVYRSMTTGDVG